MNESPGPPVDRAQVEEIFLEALELPAAERAAFLDARCAQASAVRAEVESLLDSWDVPGLVPQMDEERPFGGSYPDRVAEYRIVRPLGEGGMGVVLLAIREGPGFEQTVALKLIRGRFVDPLLARRLEEERRILARLEHPGIARLVDGGVTTEGQPYFAMEYVQGEDLLAYCDARRLGVADRIRLFTQVCDAVHHAHRQLVVHRDLKPSNILVTAEGHPKLLDFGIAKNLEPVATPEQTSRWVTPAYASPEQVAGGVVSTSSDVYALGVLLCEMLSGYRPYDTSTTSPAELARIIGERAPRRPSELVERGPAGAPDVVRGHPTPDESAARRGTTAPKLARELRGDLDQIVLKALAKEPERRYDSAWALGEDLRRHLEGRPVEARPDRLGYRASKFVRRNRGLVAAVAVVALALIGGASGILWQAGQAADERDRASLEAERARQVTALMTDIFRLGDPTQSVGDTIGVRQVLLEGARRVESSMGQDPVLQATLFLEIARIYRNLGLLDEAERLGARALALREEHEEGTLSVADALGFQGLLLRDAGRGSAAVDHMERAIALREALIAEPDTALATLLAGLGWEVRASGDYERAAALFTRALDIQRSRLGDDAPSVGTSMLGLAATFHDQGSFDEAETLFRSALANGHTESSPGAATALVNLGMVQRLDVLQARQELGLALSTLGRFAEAEPLLLANLETASRLLGRDHEGTRGAREALGTLNQELGRYDVALIHLQEALASKRRVRGSDHPGIVYSLNAIGDVLLDAGRIPEAESSFREALEMGGRLGEREGVYGALAHLGLGRAALGRGDVASADSLVTVALTMARASLRGTHRYILDIQRGQAEILLARRMPAEAAVLLQEVLQAERAVRPSPHPRIGWTLMLLGEARAALGDHEGAARAWREARTEFSGLGPDHPLRRRVESRLGNPSAASQSSARAGPLRGAEESSAFASAPPPASIGGRAAPSALPGSSPERLPGGRSPSNRSVSTADPPLTRLRAR